MKKIFEFKNKDWMKGISAHYNIPLGGLFQVFEGIDPFEQGGLALPSLTPANQVLGTNPKYLTGFQSSGVSYLYALTDTKLYQVLKNSPYTVTDVTAQIDQHTSSVDRHLGAAVWKNKYIYASSTAGNHGYISSNALPVSGSDVLILDNAFDNTPKVIIFEQGANGNLYFNSGLGLLGQLISATSTSGNSTTFKIDDGFTIRSIVNDGRYLVVFADNNNPAFDARITGSFKCKVYFWDMVQTDANSYITPEVVWDFNDSYIIGARQVDNGIEMITSSGVYTTNVATFPKLIRSFPITATAKMGVPLNPYQITASRGSLYWVDGSHNTFNEIYAYGNPITGQQKIFYNPYLQNIGNAIAQCIAVSGNQVIVGYDQPGLCIFNVGTTRGTSQITTTDITMEQPHTFDFIKVVLGQKLTSGQSVQCVALGNNGGSTISSETKSYNASNPKQSLLFRRVPQANYVDKFEDITVTISSVGAAIQRVAGYASPNDDANEDL